MQPHGPFQHPGYPYAPGPYAPPPPPPSRRAPWWVWVLLACALPVIGVIGLGAVVLVMNGGHEGGVRQTNNVERYARDRIAEYNLLQPGERIEAYFDATTGLDGTEAAIVTNRRVLYHQERTVTQVRRGEIERVERAHEPLVERFTVVGRDGTRIGIAVPVLNGAEQLYDALERARRSQGE